MSKTKPISIENELDALAVDNFREYLRIPSVHPDINYEPCVEFLKKQADEIGLPLQVFYCYPNKPMVIITWTGEQPDLPSIFFNSHMDVVPVFREEWKYDPFAAEMDEQGNIYARGAQDTKAAGIQYLEALRRLKKQKTVFKRTIHVCFASEEEIGGAEGMGAFVKTEDFQKLNVGFAVDEGMAHLGDEFLVTYGERAIWQFSVNCPGQSGHSSLLLENTPAEKVRYMLDKFYDLRNEEKKKLQDNPSLTVGDVTTVNATELKGGVQPNVIPPDMAVVVDSRIGPKLATDEWEATLNQWCKEAGEGVGIEFIQKNPQIPPTKLDGNPYWASFQKAAAEMNIILKPQMRAGGTDTRYLREIGLPAVGFAPMNKTPPLFHAHNEFLNVNIFLRGIEIYTKLIPAIANTEE